MSAGDRHATRRSGNQILAALGAACIDNGSATARFHAGAETVRARMLELAGLESALHGDAFEKSTKKERENS